MTAADDTISRYFAAMRKGPDGEQELLALFAEDAVYREPFIKPGNPAVGRDEIRQRLQTGWARAIPDLELDVLTVSIEDTVATSTWECRSPAFPGPVRGTDRYRFRDGLIVELDVSIDDRPDPEG